MWKFLEEYDHHINRVGRSLFSYFIWQSLLWCFQVHTFFLIKPEQLSFPFFFFHTTPTLYTPLKNYICIKKHIYRFCGYNNKNIDYCTPMLGSMVFNLSLFLWSLKYIKIFKAFILEYNCGRLASFPIHITFCMMWRDSWSFLFCFHYNLCH